MTGAATQTTGSIAPKGEGVKLCGLSRDEAEEAKLIFQLSEEQPEIYEAFRNGEISLLDALRQQRSAAKKIDAKLSETFSDLRTIGWKPVYKLDYFRRIITAGFNRATFAKAFVLFQLVADLGPITVRGAMYRGVHAGIYSGTGDDSYQNAQIIILKLRRAGILPYSKISDSTRRRLKPSSWSGLADFMETAKESYRKDLWAKQPDYIEFFVEKDAMAGVLEPATEEYDVVLNIVRGGCSETLLYNIAEQWNEIEKPIAAYYFGDHDPSGLLIEQDIRKRLAGFCKRPFTWHRLGVTTEQFTDPDILGFPIKRPPNPTPRNMKAWHTRNDPYIARYGDRCVEVDALSPDVARQLVKDAIESHIDRREWDKLKQVEELEKESAAKLPQLFKKGGLFNKYR
jgi:hypothetical protein